MKSWLKWLFIIVVLAGAGGGWFWYSKRSDTKAPQYRTAQATRGDLTQAVTASGQLNPIINVQVGSQVSGIIEKLFADFNSTVTNGQILAQLDPATFQASLKQSEGELANAQAALQLARINARRAEDLLKNALIPQAEYDTTLATLQQAQALVTIREAATERARVDLARTTIYAPIDGIVISRNVDVGQTVAASFSAPTLFVIANDLSKMQINAMVSEADVGGVEDGQRVEFTVDAFPYRTFEGKVTQIRNSPVTNQNVVAYDTVIDVNNRDSKLKPGMTANVKIVIAERESAVAVPNAALRFRPPETILSQRPSQSTSSGANQTRTVASASPTGAGSGPTASQGAGTGGGSDGGGGRGGNREAMRSEMGRFGSPEGGGGRRRERGAGGGGERAASRTVYVLSNAESTDGKAAQPTLKPVQVKVGISDGSQTEIIDGLKEGDVVVLGLAVAEPANAQRPGGPGGPPNPFGGGGMRRF